MKINKSLKRYKLYTYVIDTLNTIRDKIITVEIHNIAHLCVNFYLQLQWYLFKC